MPYIYGLSYNGMFFINNIRFFQKSSRLPDFNRIESFYTGFARNMYANRGHLADLTGLEKVILEERHKIFLVAFFSLADGMPKRCTAVLHHQGKKIKY